MKHFVLHTITAVITAALVIGPANAACYNNAPASGWASQVNYNTWQFAAFDQDRWLSHEWRLDKLAGRGSWTLYFHANTTITLSPGNYQMSVLGVNTCGQLTGEVTFIKGFSVTQ